MGEPEWDMDESEWDIGIPDENCMMTSKKNERQYTPLSAKPSMLSLGVANFMGKVFTHFPKPSRKFVEECIYGIQASGDTKRKTVPLALRLWSSRAPGFRGENDEVLKILRAMPVRLPMHPEKELHLVVARGFGLNPVMLPASLPVDGSFKSQWRVVGGYLSRWRIEETIRFVKQAYGFENIRVMTYARIRNMASLVLASAYFATAWIGRSARREVLAEHLAHLGKRLGEVPEFAAYAIAEMASSLHRWRCGFGIIHVSCDS